MPQSKRALMATFLVVLPGLLLTACAAPATPTELPVAAVTDTPSATSTSSPTRSATPTLTPTRTATHTASPTATDTPTETATPTATNTPRPRPTPTPQPTATSTPNPRPEAPLFPDTHIWPFDPDSLIGELDKTNSSFDLFFGIFSRGVQTGSLSCSAYVRERDKWLNALGYAGVPDPWYSIYYDYRVLVRDAVAVTAPLDAPCGTGGGPVSGEVVQAIIAFFQPAVPRMADLAIAARALK